MRPVDADALYNGAMKEEYFDYIAHDNDGRESFAYSCAMQRLVEAPAIDAIPVEWLENMQMESMSENDRTMVGAIEAILIEWHIYVNRLREIYKQKEQERYNG